MAEAGEFRFEIDGFTPTTLSMRRLQDYIPHLVEIFGNQDDVHLLRVEDGSATPCIFAKQRVLTRVERRLLAIKTGHGSRKSYRAMDSINELLVEDDTSAVLKSPHFGIVIEFPGNKQSKEPIFGPISETGDLQGELFQVGGRDQTISIYLRSEGEIYICTGTREQGRQISEHLFKSVRVFGDGKWMRGKTGRWKLVSFILKDFRPLSETTLSQAIGSLRDLGRRLEVKPDISLLSEDD